MKKEIIELLIKKAKEVRKLAYAPYSNFKVGAALLTKSGKIYTGCNVENASYGATVCAERVAMFKAVSEGERKFEAIAVYVETEILAFPCALCRQVMYEFSPDMKIISANKDRYEVKTLDELFPYPFGPKDLLKSGGN
ncbi:MAG: cytidine deaminase [Caldiserica bacterium]|nr:MAG: cytidine deaminase [Caldisericota bacterium]